jgi:hypothetical protein
MKEKIKSLEVYVDGRDKSDKDMIPVLIACDNGDNVKAWISWSTLEQLGEAKKLHGNCYSGFHSHNILPFKRKGDNPKHFHKYSHPCFIQNGYHNVHMTKCKKCGNSVEGTDSTVHFIRLKKCVKCNSKNWTLGRKIGKI